MVRRDRSCGAARAAAHPRLDAAGVNITDEDLQQLVADLHRKYPPDVAQQALLALYARPEWPLDPEGFCHRVAWRLSRPYAHTTEARDRVRLVHVSTGPSEAERHDHVFGSTPPAQLNRLVAREQLETLDPKAILRGLGVLLSPAEQSWVTRRRRLKR